MKINATTILNDIKEKISAKDIFKNNLEDLVKALIQAEKELVGYVAYHTKNTFVVEDCIAQFRAILKFIYLNSKLENVSVYSYQRMKKEFMDMIIYFQSNYTPVRNYLEQCALGKRKIVFDEKRNYYVEPSFDSSSNYARVKTKVTEFPSKEIKDHVILSMQKVYVKNPKSFFRNRYVQSLMQEMIDANWIDSEIKFNYDFKDFTYNELITFCASIQMIGFYYELSIETPDILKEDFIHYIQYLTNFTEEKINFFLDYFIYDIEYQKDKLTLLQSIIEIGNKIYFLPMTLSIGLLPLKLYRSIIDHNRKKYEKDLSKIARLKEKQMTDEIVNCLKKYDVKVITDFAYKVGEETTSKAEYDILILDNIKNELYVCECKWFFVGDGEEEHFRLDNKISNAIADRIIKNKHIETNLNDFMQKAFNSQIPPQKVSAFMISQNYLGTTKLDLPVIDFETLKSGVGKFEDFSKLMHYLIENEFVKSIETIEEPSDLEAEGYKFEIYEILLKANNLNK